MKTRRLQKSMFIISIVLCLWLLAAQSCMKMRISDNKAKQSFSKKGVNLFTNYFQSNQFRLHYAKTGNDTFPTLFFVHGSPGSWDAFQQYLQDSNLLARYRMIAIDRPGFGFSQFGDAKNLQEQSNIIGPLLQHINNGKPMYIVGHSLGGPLAVQLVADYPQQFSGMVLLAAAVDPAEEPAEKWRGIFLHSSLHYLLPGAFRPSNAELWYLKKDIYTLSTKFSHITCPVWIIHGNKDTFVPVGNAAYAKKMLANAPSVSTYILEGAPHFIPWEPWYKYVKTVLLELH